MENNLTGNLNTALGYQALNANTAAHEVSAVGYRALANYTSTGSTWNTALGSLAGENFTTGTQNVMIGTWAMRNHLTGIRNTAVGNVALYNGATGDGNTAIGDNSLLNTSGNNNVGLGRDAGNNISSGSNNTLMGYVSDVSVGTLINATAVGANALVSQNNSMVLGSINGLNSATATVNVGIGETSPNARLHITRNGASGGTYHVSSSLIIEDNTSSYIQLTNPNANETGILSGNASNFIRSAFIFASDSTLRLRAGGNINRMIVDNNGNVGIGTMTPAYQLELSTNSAGKPLSNAWTISSDERLKTIDGNYTKGLADILKLNTIKYHYAPGNARNLPTEEQGYGFSAQEVQKVFPEAVKTGKDGYLNFDIHPILVSYINAFKEQQQQIEDLKKKNEKLEKDMQLIRAKLGINN